MFGYRDAAGGLNFRVKRFHIAIKILIRTDSLGNVYMYLLRAEGSKTIHYPAVYPLRCYIGE